MVSVSPAVALNAVDAGLPWAVLLMAWHTSHEHGYDVGTLRSEDERGKSGSRPWTYLVTYSGRHP